MLQGGGGFSPLQEKSCACIRGSTLLLLSAPPGHFSRPGRVTLIKWNWNSAAFTTRRQPCGIWSEAAGAEGNLEAARSLSANIQHSESSLQRLLEGSPEPDRLVIQHKPRLTCRQQDIAIIYSCFPVGIHDNLPIIQAAVQILRITSCQ